MQFRRDALVTLLLAMLMSTATWAEELRSSKVVSTLNANDACKVAIQETLNESETFSIEGLYFSDGHHDAMFEVQGCSIIPEFADQAKEKVRIFHDEFKKKCNATLMNDILRGTFIGTFKKRQHYSFSTNSTLTANVFVIVGFETKDFSPEAIKCP